MRYYYEDPEESSEENFSDKRTGLETEDRGES
jgi:hypothetical protein